ncbi:olfactory receptor 2AT4-like [Protopterus annectens]|uniref:olfactory receptor 2AT4-like n=1 Tax=Protopterus annectens TaxID=7888 RepID=UPI001CFBF7BB|nr:olfactory receptor 2AT4-like [Protopterus annectens]
MGDERGYSETEITEFVLVGFPYFPGYQPALFAVLLVIYLIILAGNASILTVVIVDRRLHKPMYFFLGNLAAIDIMFTTTTIPKMLALFLINSNTISFTACFTQLCVLHVLALFECFLLVVMAYDRYIAICNPLHYMSVMTKRFIIKMTIGCFILACIAVVSLVIFTAFLPYCGPNKINNCFCDHFFISKLACTDITAITIWTMCLVLICVFIPFLLVVFSYVNIFRSVLKTSSAGGRWKTFSTCSSHLAVVIIYYLSIVVSYSSYRTDDISSDFHAVGTIFFAVLAPALNPVIYTLRNKEVKEVVKMYIMRAVVPKIMMESASREFDSTPKANQAASFMGRLDRLLTLERNPLLSVDTTVSSTHAHELRADNHDEFLQLFHSTRNNLYKFKRLQWQRLHFEACLQHKVIPRGLQICKMPTYSNSLPDLLKEWQMYNLEISAGYLRLLIKYFTPIEEQLRKSISEDVFNINSNIDYVSYKHKLD